MKHYRIKEEVFETLSIYTPQYRTDFYLSYDSNGNFIWFDFNNDGQFGINSIRFNSYDLALDFINTHKNTRLEPIKTIIHEIS